MYVKIETKLISDLQIVDQIISKYMSSNFEAHQIAYNNIYNIYIQEDFNTISLT